MTIKIRNKKICTTNMSVKNLFRLTNLIDWEISKAKGSRKNMLDFIKLILNNKISIVLHKDTI